MTVQKFPSMLQPIIELGFAEREFGQAMLARYGYRSCVDRVPLVGAVGSTHTIRRAVPPSAAADANVVDVTGQRTVIGEEQYTITLNRLAPLNGLRMLTDRVGIVSQFLQNAYTNGEQAARQISKCAGEVLAEACLSGNTWVRVAKATSWPKISVDDIRGFQTTSVAGVAHMVSRVFPLDVIVGSQVYTLISTCADKANMSTVPGGISGVLEFHSGLRVRDAVVGNTVTAVTASTVVRSGNRANTTLLEATDKLTDSDLVTAVAKLIARSVPTIDDYYNCYIDPISARQLFADPDFKARFPGAISANQVFRQGTVNGNLGLRFIPMLDDFMQPHPTLPGLMVHRVAICGRGALVEGAHANMATDADYPADSLITVIDGVAMITTPASVAHALIDQSWCWVGGFGTPLDVAVRPFYFATKPNAAFKRAVMIEHIG